MTNKEEWRDGLVRQRDRARATHEADVARLEKPDGPIAAPGRLDPRDGRQRPQAARDVVEAHLADDDRNLAASRHEFRLTNQEWLTAEMEIDNGTGSLPLPSSFGNRTRLRIAS